jgi:hypothetical protein
MNFEVSGDVSGGASHNVRLWTSSLDYNVSVGGASLSGYKYDIGRLGGSGRIIEQGENNWGTQTLQVWFNLSDPFWNFRMSANSYAVAEAAGSGSPVGTTNFAEADFSHTLRWLGISAVSAYDANGVALVLPTDFALNMVGEDSGFNYRFAAPGAATTVPEPAGWATLVLGLALICTVMHGRSVPSR